MEGLPARGTASKVQIKKKKKSGDSTGKCRRRRPVAAERRCRHGVFSRNGGCVLLPGRDLRCAHRSTRAQSLHLNPLTLSCFSLRLTSRWDSASVSAANLREQVNTGSWVIFSLTSYASAGKPKRIFWQKLAVYLEASLARAAPSGHWQGVWRETRHRLGVFPKSPEGASRPGRFSVNPSRCLQAEHTFFAAEHVLALFIRQNPKLKSNPNLEGS